MVYFGGKSDGRKFFGEILGKFQDESENGIFVKTFFNHDERVPSVYVVFVGENKNPQVRGIVNKKVAFYPTIQK